MPIDDENVVVMDEKEARAAFNASRIEAEKLLAKPDEIEKLLIRLEKKLKEVPHLGGSLALIPDMGLLVKYYIEGKYTEIPIGTIVATVGVILYFVSPIDIIPDFIPGAGLIDDVAVAAFAYTLVKSDIDEFMEWYRNEKKDNI